MIKLDIGRSVYHFLQYIYIYIYIPTRYTIMYLVGMYIYLMITFIHNIQ